MASVDGDGKLDLVVSSKSEKGVRRRKILKFEESGAIAQESLMNTERALSAGYASSLADVDNDFEPEMVMGAGEAGETRVFEVWAVKNRYYEYSAALSYEAPQVLPLSATFWDYLERLALSFTPYQTFMFLEILFEIRNQHKILRKKESKNFIFCQNPPK